MKKILFATRQYGYLAEKMLAAGDFKKGELEVSQFTDGERYQRIFTDVQDRNVVLLGGTVNDEATLELFDLATSLVSNGANSLSLVIPYFGYSTMERAVLPGEIVTAKTRAILLSAIPRSNKGNKIYLFDIHSEGIPYYFEHGLHPIHVYCKDIVTRAARDFGGENFIMASTDAGRAKWVESLANDAGVNAAFILKRRLKGDHTEITAINADVEGKTVVIYDDMIRSGGSIINAAKTYKDAGAAEIIVIATHGLFVGDGLNKMKNCGAIRKLICTDSHPNTRDLDGDDFIDVRSIAGLINASVG
jgi:ribose-phosphate pyrophosphokinase